MSNAQLNTLQLVEAVRKRVVDFTSADLFVRDRGLADSLRTIWSGNETGRLVSELWAEGMFPPETSCDTLKTFLDNEILQRKFYDTLIENTVFPENAPLYKHQTESWRMAYSGYGRAEKPAIAVTAGTGAGKTESFLFPLLNDLFLNASEPGQGVSAIILYPMNALVNDQVDRLYQWLRGQTTVTLFHFTSETPEDWRAANQAEIPHYDPCRIRTRNQARGLEDEGGRKLKSEGSVPRILVTNYSMLEYMLCRPQDNVFFGKNLRTVVLDEAHLYTGTLAAEITLLQRRLLMRCGVRPEEVVQFATSATINSDALKPFMAKLFSKPERLIHVVEGKAKRTPLPQCCPPVTPTTFHAINAETWPDGMPFMENDTGGKVMLRVADSAEIDKWKSCLAILLDEKRLDKHCASCENIPAQLLFFALKESPLVHQLERILWNRKRLPVNELARELFGTSGQEAIEAIRHMLQLCASARCSVGDYPLIPNRVHFLVRGADGVTVFFDDRKRNNAVVWPERRLSLVPGFLARCPEMETYGLFLARCRQCGSVYYLGREEEGGRLVSDNGVDKKQCQVFRLPREPQNELERQSIVRSLVFQPDTGHVSGHGDKGIELHEIKGICPECHSDIEEIRPFIGGGELLRNLVAETVLANVPEKSGSDRDWLPGRGRRLLAFSDSRSAAARLGPSLTRQHAIQLCRALIIRCAPDIDSKSIEWHKEDLEVNRNRLASTSSEVARARLKVRIGEIEQDLSLITSGGSVSDWANLIKKSPLLAELPDIEGSRKHVADKWRQTSFEEHRREMAKQVNFLIGRELARRPSWPNITLEGLGSVEIVYPRLDELRVPDEFLGTVPRGTATFLENSWTGMIASLLDSIRTDGAITLGDAELDLRFIPDGGHSLVGKWFSLDDTFGGNLVAWSGKTKDHRRNAYIRRILSSSASPSDCLVKDVLRIAFQQLSIEADSSLTWLQKENRQTETGSVLALRMDFSKIALRRLITPWRCQKTGQVWPRAVNNDAPATVPLDLRQVTPSELDLDARIGRHRIELRENLVFSTGVWGEEHSAQLSPQENRRLQDLFKAGVRNLLSSTTTLELGIDIGGLHAVLMANIPPGKANYLQRAGRAGRRADGSAAVIGFVRQQPYEQAVFHNFGQFLDAPLRKPNVFLDRERIVFRHWNALLLGTFFQTHLSGRAVGAMRAYGTMGQFCGLPKANYWEKGGDKPVLKKADKAIDCEFIKYLNKESKNPHKWEITRETLRKECPSGVLDASIPELFENAKKAFLGAVKRWKMDYQATLKDWDSISDDIRKANAVYHQLSVMFDVTVIECLADLQVLPRYGFPIGLNRLQVKIYDDAKKVVREEDSFRLERSSLLALQEYVPGSILMAGNRRITSRGILKHWTAGDVNDAFGLSGRLATCQNGHVSYSVSGVPKECPLCEKALQGFKTFLMPKHGYTTAVWDPPKYGYNVERVGHVTSVTLAFRDGTSDAVSREDFAEMHGVKASWCQDGEILVTNTGEHQKGFAICTKCGYAESECEEEQGRMKLPTGFEKHASLFSPNRKSECWKDATGEVPVLRNRLLGARQNTDILLLDWGTCLRFNDFSHREIHKALATALRLSGARILELDIREIGVLTDIPTGENGEGLGSALFDDTPGGCGHVLELMKIGRPWLVEARKLLYVDAAHHKSCEHGCLRCILIPDHGSPDNLLPDRLGAYDLLDALLTGKSWTAPAVVSQPPTATQPQLPLQTASQNARLLKQRLQTFVRSKSVMAFEKKRWKAVLEQLDDGELSEQEIAAKLDELRSDSQER